MNTTMSNTSTPQSEYMMFFRGGHWDKDLSPEELQQAMARISAWFDDLHQKGKIKGGQPLGDEGRRISGKDRTDGPFVESKEAIGGYLVVLADSLEEATAMARACPNLLYGVSIEVRPVLEECPTVQRVKQRLAMAAA